MEEIEMLHNLNLEWGCLTNLMDKISDIEDKIEGGWPELIDMVADAVEEGGNEEDPAELFFSLYNFLFRLYHRLKINPAVRPFNKIERLSVLDKDYFRVTNYGYGTFKWAHKQGIVDKISNDYIDIEISKLDDKQRRAFERRCEGKETQCTKD